MGETMAMLLPEIVSFVLGSLMTVIVWFIFKRFEDRSHLHIETKQGKDGRWRFYLKGQNGHEAAISTGDGWETEYAAMREANRLAW